jgi:hypothetical protein
MFKWKCYFLFTISVLFLYFIFFTEYAPDMYVFVKYSLFDNKTKNLTIDSFINNNFIFDLIALLGYFLGLNNAFSYLSLISFFSYLLFLLKYYYLSIRGSFLSIILVFIASFLTFDLNIFRFHLAIFFLIIIYFTNNKILKVFSFISSFSSHLFPVLFLITKRFYFLPFIFIFFIFKFLPDSRLNLYLDGFELKFFKSFILILPSISCLTEVYLKKSISFDDKRVYFAYTELSTTFLVFGIILLFFNSVIASRLFETVFYLSVVFNVFYNFSRLNYFFLYLFAILMLFSRLINGINSGDNNFIEQLSVF